MPAWRKMAPPPVRFETPAPRRRRAAAPLCVTMTDEHATPVTRRRHRQVPLLGATAVCVFAVVALAVLAMWLWRTFELGDLDMSDEAMESFIASWGMWSALGSIVAMVLHSFVPLPAEFIALANGMIFGTVWGIVLTWTGAMLGAVMSFGLARWLGQPLVRRLVPKRHWDTLRTWEADQGAVALLIARLIPVISFNLINYAAGLAGIRWPVFLWTTAIGIVPLTVLSVVMGHALLDAPKWVWGLVVVGLIFASVVFHRLRRRAE